MDALVGGAVVLVVLIGLWPSAERAQAANCDRVAIAGAGPSVWKVSFEGGFEEGNLFSRPLGAFRADAFDDYGHIAVDGTAYENEDARCTRESGQEWLLAGERIGALRVTPKVYADPRRPLGRTYFSIKNVTAAPVEVDLVFGPNDNLGSDGDTEVDRTSSGDGIASAADSWATSCEDIGGDGCADVADEEVRDPEMSLNWERAGGGPRSADLVDFADGGDNIEVTFNNVNIPAGKTIGLMNVVTMNLNIGGARKAAARTANDPSGAGVFRALSKRERKRLVNW